MTKTLWHPAFCEAMKLELHEYRDVLEFQDEHQLTSGSLRIDTLIIKKLKNIVIDKDIARIFRNYNIFEYKSPDDSLDIHDYYKTHAYKLFYFFQNKISDIDDISVTIVASQHPYNLLKYLSNRYKDNITSPQKGIYVVDHDMGPTQIIVSSKLAKDKNLWLTHLNKQLTATRLQRLLTEAAKHGKDSALETYLDVIAEANFKTFQEVIMGKAIDRCLKELGLVDKWRAEGRAEGKTEGEAKGEAKTIIRILSRRLEPPSASLQKKINSIRNIAKLDELTDFALTCVSLDEFATALK
ncbi:MAG: DUF4351 domain-containing protein [Planctomycetaceae bacterium]|jgi:hypothetical protein|nr:DUF4351 domain-containing protein [Planctomycetaceae bacterium]